MILCFVKFQWAYFTPRTLAEQSGDDWNDAPYEHNAEPPYESDIIKVAFDGDFEAPCDGVANSRYSVDDINGGGVAWLRGHTWAEGPRVFIPGGVSLSEFIELIELGGGHVYLRKESGAK